MMLFEALVAAHAAHAAFGDMLGFIHLKMFLVHFLSNRSLYSHYFLLRISYIQWQTFSSWQLQTINSLDEQ